MASELVVPNLPPHVKANCDPLPQPAPRLPHHHGPNIPEGTPYPVKMSKGGLAHPIGTAVLFEDEEIILWENRAPPGMDGALHNHDHDYWIAAAFDTSNRNHKTIVKREHDNYKEVKLPGGGGPGVTFVKKGHLETATMGPDCPTNVVYLVEIKKPEEGGKPSPAPPGFGAMTGVVFENTEVKISDMRVPPGQRGSLVPEKGNGLLQVDVRGKRQGAQDVKELLDANEGDEVKGGAKVTFMGAYLFFKKKWGTTYYRPAGVDEPGPEGGLAGEVHNTGTEDYRGILIEIKPVEPAITARL